MGSGASTLHWDARFGSDGPRSVTPTASVPAYRPHPPPPHAWQAAGVHEAVPYPGTSGTPSLRKSASRKPAPASAADAEGSALVEVNGRAPPTGAILPSGGP